jgi:hypothetical protein
VGNATRCSADQTTERGFSYSQYLKAYECTEEKGFLPYEWMTLLEKLNVSQLQPHEAFYSTLKNGNISAEEFTSIALLPIQTCSMSDVFGCFMLGEELYVENEYSETVQHLLI